MPPSSANAAVDEDSPESRILDAALVQFERVGVKKSTIEDIARIAGVDRVTVYRRIGSRDDLVRAVFTREVTNLLVELEKLTVKHDNIADLIAESLVTVIRAWRTNKMVQRLMTLEPDRLLPQLSTEGGATFTMAVAATTLTIEAAADRGLVPRHADAAVRAEILCRIVQSLILLPSATVPLDSDSELDRFARRYLTSIVTD